MFSVLYASVLYLSTLDHSAKFIPSCIWVRKGSLIFTGDNVYKNILVLVQGIIECMKRAWMIP